MSKDQPKNKTEEKETARGMEAVIKNATVMNRSAISGVKFSEGDKVLISNEDYAAQELRIVQLQKDGGDVHATLQGHGVNMVVEVSWLQREYARGKLLKLDPKTGKPIRHQNMSDGTGA